MRNTYPKTDAFFRNAVKWGKELQQLRNIILDCGLTEELKWGSACYTYDKKNIVIIGELKECCVIGFFKGALLKDTEGILQKPGENTRSARTIRFSHMKEIQELAPTVTAYIHEAIEVEKAGLKVDLKNTGATIPDEFRQKLNRNAELKSAFYGLTPGRQRAYLLHFAQPKLPKTREARIEKFIPHILRGKGMYDR